MQTNSQTNQQVAGHANHNYMKREPPPYPGRPLYQPGLRQSYSSSETSTDMSLSSCENLSSTVRQDPQGEETVASDMSPIEPPHMPPEAIYCRMSALRSPPPKYSEPIGMKSMDSSTFYLTGNLDSKMMLKGDHGYNMVNSSHGSHNANHGNLKFNANMNNNNSNRRRGGSMGGVYAGESRSPMMNARVPQGKTLMSQYQREAMRSLCQQMCSTQNLYSSGGLAANPSLVTAASILTQNNINNNKMMTENKMAAGLIETDNQSISQLMTALNRHSVNLSSSSRDRQRPSTAPSMRHQQSMPPPPQYPGYDLAPSPDLERLSLRRSQPDLTRLTELSSNQQFQDVMLHSNEQQAKVSRPSDLEIEPLLGSIHRMGPKSMMNGSVCGIQQMSALPTTAPSNVQQQLVQLQAMQAGEQLLRPMMSSSPQLLRSDPLISMTTTGHGSANSCPDRVQMGLQRLSPSKFVELDYAARSQADSSCMMQRSPLVDHAAIATRATQMVERLSEENRSLRQELEGYYKKVDRLQKLEIEIQKVHENYENLVRHSHKQQNIEKLIRFKMEAEIKKIRETNKDLKDQLDKALRQLQHKEVYAMSDPEIKKELLGKDSLISKLINQNQDLTLAKDQLEAEVMSQKSSMHDQSVHMRLLESALNSARLDILKYEEQSRKRKSDDDKITELQKALTQLQGAVEKRESIEQELRLKLEEEVLYLRKQQQQKAGMNKMADTDEGISSDSESPTSLQSLAKQMSEKEQRILTLEAEVAKWKQKYLEETALRQFMVDSACAPKDARIASLEQSSLETERRMADARHDCYKQKDEVHSANHRSAELEAKLKSIRAQLAEKDALIRVLQRHMSRSSNITSILCSPLHSPRPSFIASSPIPSPLASPLISHNSSATPSGASSRQNSLLETASNFSSGSSTSGTNIMNLKDGEGKASLHSKSNGTGSAVSSISSSSRDPQLQDLTQRLAAQPAAFGVQQPGTDEMKKYLWQV